MQSPAHSWLSPGSSWYVMQSPSVDSLPIIIQSVLAYFKELNGFMARRSEGYHPANARSRSPVRSRDRDGLPSQSRVSDHPSKDRLPSRKSDTQVSALTSRASSLDARKERSSSPRKRTKSKNRRRRTVDEAIAEELAPLDVVLETVEGAQPSTGSEREVTSTAPMIQISVAPDSDVSTAPSSDVSMSSSASAPEPPSPTGRGVL